MADAGQLREAMPVERTRDWKAETGFIDESFWRFEIRVVSPLVGFGLLERPPDPDPTADGSIFRQHYQVRRTSLFDRFLAFDLG